MKPLKEKFHLFPDLAKLHVEPEPENDKAVLPYVDINEKPRRAASEIKEQPKPTIELFESQAKKYKQGRPEQGASPDFRALMKELKEAWQIKETKNTQPVVTYTAHVRGLQQTILAQLR